MRGCLRVVWTAWMGAGWMVVLFPLIARGKAPPNIVFLLADDQCTYSLGCYGAPQARTRNIDQLAAEGISFDRFYATTAICMASRASIFTGRYEHRHGCNFEHGPLVRSLWQHSYPVLLRQAGYRTAIAGKIGIEVSERPGTKGELPESDFDAWAAGPGQTSYESRKNPALVPYAGEYPHSTLAYAAWGSDFIRHSAAQGRPFCLSISFKAPHHPVQPDRRFEAIYAGVAFDRPANFGRQNGSHFSLQSRRGRQYERFHSWGYATDYDAVMAKYYQQIYAIDAAVGMLRRAVDEAGVAGNTIFIFTSDNGFLCGAHGYASKVLPYEEASRVPLVIFDPRTPAARRGIRCDALTGNIDIAPTVLELAGVRPPADMDGQSLVPCLDDPEVSLHDELALMNVWGPHPVHSLAIVTTEYKYIYWPYAADGLIPTEELYDMQSDRLEMHNLVGQPRHAIALDGMRDRYDALVEAWRRRSVPFHGYARFGIIFDRKAAWDRKETAYRGGTGPVRVWDAALPSGRSIWLSSRHRRPACCRWYRNSPGWPGRWPPPESPPALPTAPARPPPR